MSYVRVSTYIHTHLLNLFLIHVFAQSTWPGPDQCTASASSDLFDACPGCPSVCTFGHCEKFDLECIANGLTDEDKKADALVMYSEKGTCQCLNTADCPETVYSCRCPVGLARVCKECNASAQTGVCESAPHNVCNSNNDCAARAPCLKLAPMYCPKVCVFVYYVSRHVRYQHRETVRERLGHLELQGCQRGELLCYIPWLVGAREVTAPTAATLACMPRRC
jgi:hypothetical protein